MLRVLLDAHVHLLLGLSGLSDLMSTVGAWKSRCSLLRRRRGLSKRFWQRSFYDHALRREEDLLVVTRYILENPIRAGLVESAIEYPLSGSFEFPLDGLGPASRGGRKGRPYADMVWSRSDARKQGVGSTVAS